MKGVVSHPGHATLNRLVFCNRDDLGGHDVGDFYLARVEALGGDFSQELECGQKSLPGVLAMPNAIRAWVITSSASPSTSMKRKTFSLSLT
jgi:hypothetical protein